MKGINYILPLLCVLAFSNVMAQQTPFIGIRSYSGELGLSAFYKYQDRISPAITENQRVNNFKAGVSLNSQSYLWTPKFFLLDLGGAYNPISEQNLFLVTPDRNEVRTLKKLSLRATFLSDKPISFYVFKNYHENFAKRDLLTDVRYKGSSQGAAFTLRNKILPLMVEYQQNTWQQEEIEQNRLSNNVHNVLWAKTEKSFSRRDKTSLDFHHNEYRYQGFELNEVANTNDIIDFRNSLFLDSLQRSGLNSKVSFFRQTGNQPFQRLQAFENLNLSLPANLTLLGTYQYSNDIRPIATQVMNTARAQLDHRLYASLRTQVYFEYKILNQTAFDERNLRSGGSLKYSKKIPTGSLNLNYSYNRLDQGVDQELSMPQVFDEEQALFDNQVVFLNQPQIELNTIQVTDITGGIIYQLNLDYLLFERGQFVEIQRIPGGRIADGSTVLIDYVYRQNADYSFILNHHSVGANLSLFNRLLSLFVRYSTQDYQQIDTSDFVVLKPFRDLHYGGNLNYRIFSGGVEYRHFNSIIGPFKMLRYHLQASHTLTSKLQFSIMASRKRFVRLDQDRTEFYTDVYGGLTYMFNPRSKLDLNIGYRDQKGRQLDLNLFTTRVQYSTSFRLLSLNVGGAIFRRDYINETIDYNNLYIQLLRRF